MDKRKKILVFTLAVVVLILLSVWMIRGIQATGKKSIQLPKASQVWIGGYYKNGEVLVDDESVTEELRKSISEAKWINMGEYKEEYEETLRYWQLRFVEEKDGTSEEVYISSDGHYLCYGSNRYLMAADLALPVDRIEELFAKYK